VDGDHTLSSSNGALTFGSTLDSPNRANLSLAALGGAIDVGAAIGNAGALGALTLQSGTSTRMRGAVQAGSIVQAGAAGLTRFDGAVTADGEDGIQLNGHSFRFDGAVTASAGAISLANTSAQGTVEFGREAAVQATTGFTQTGGASLLLPASISVTQGGITLEAPASLPGGTATITTDGDIVMAGLVGPATALTINAGTGVRTTDQAGTHWRAFGIDIGRSGGGADQKINVASLAVTTASDANLYGMIGGKGGALAASRIDSELIKAPYFINDTPWGPLEVINVLVATTVPQGVVPSTPGAGPLFTGVVDRSGVAPNVLGVYASPQVLTVAPMAPLATPAAGPAAPAANGTGSAPKALPTGPAAPQGAAVGEAGDGEDRPPVDER
jgi:hypothetical protein